MSLVWTEGDTTIFTICNKIRENGRRETIVIDAGDTDIYVQTACVSQKVSGEILTKKKNIYVDNQTLFTTCNGWCYYSLIWYDWLWSQMWFLWAWKKQQLKQTNKQTKKTKTKTVIKKSYEKLWSKSSVT